MTDKVLTDGCDQAEMDKRLLVDDNCAKPSAIGSKLDRAVLQSSWIRRLKPFASSEEEEEVDTSPDPGHVWTHFTKDFRSCSRRSNKSPFHVRSSSWPEDGMHAQEKLAQPLSNKEQLHPPTYANIPFVPSDDHGRSTDLSWKTGNLLMGQQNSYTKRHSSTEAIVPCFQNIETISVEKPKDPYEASDTLKYKSDDDSFIRHFQSEVKDDSRAPWGGRGFQRPPLHSRNIKKGLTTIKDNTLLSQPHFLQYDGAQELVQDETASANCRESFHCSKLNGNKESHMVVVSHNKTFNTSLMQSQDSHGLKLQNQKATRKIDCYGGKLRPKTAVNFGFLLFPQNSSSGSHVANSAKVLEDNHYLESNASRPQNTARMCSVGSSQVARVGKTSILQGCESLNIIDGSTTNHIQSHSFCDDFVSFNDKTGTTRLQKGTPRLSLPEANVDDYWSNWMDIFAKSTPVMPGEANSSTACLPRDYILEEYHKQQLKQPESVIQGKKPRDTSMANELKLVKSRYQNLCSTDLHRKGSLSLQGNGNFSGQDHSCKGSNGNKASIIGDTKNEQKTLFTGVSDPQRSYSTQQVWIRRWASTAQSGKLASVYPESKKSTCSDLLISSNPNICSSVGSWHSKEKNINRCNHQLTNSITEAKHVEITPACFRSTRQTSGTSFCAKKSNANTFGNSMSKNTEAMAIVGTTANKAALIQRKGSFSVWPCPAATVTSDVEHHDISDEKLWLNVDGP